MKHITINLNEKFRTESNAKIECFCSEIFDGNDPKKPALIIAPGGGYYYTSNREADPIALTFLLKGYNCFVVRYTVFDDNINKPIHPQPVLDLMMAFDYIYNHADEFGILKERMFLMGFSAGGHLIGSYSYLYKDQNLLSMIGVSKYEHLKPKGICLAYPVVTMGQYTHVPSRDCLIGDDSSLFDKLSIEMNVESDYPPTFLWTTITDQCVDPKNTLLMQEALKNNGVKNETTIFSSGEHGLSIATDLVDSSNEEAHIWIERCDNFFKTLI